VNGALWGRDIYPGCFDECDSNGNGAIQVGEIVLAVNYALGGCPP
jgi:hypothetical protein